jgi:adenylate kinase
MSPLIRKPNILISGTPGTGKSVTSQAAAERLGLRVQNVTELVMKHECHEGRDEEFDTLILDEDKLLDVMEPLMEEGGNVVDYHSCDLFPERWFDLVIILTASTEVLYDRLLARGYSKKKLDENIECEIMQIVMESAMESYPQEIVQVLSNNTLDEMDSNISRLAGWYDAWLTSNS